MPESQKKDPTIADLLGSSIFDPVYIEQEIKKEQETYQKFEEELKHAHERGEDISEYVWPYEWDFRERPEPHHANNIVSLADAIDLCGEHFYGNEWKAEDWYARSPKHIEQWNPANNTYRVYSFPKKGKGANFTSRAEEEKQAFIRKQEIYSKLSSWLNQGVIESFTLDHEGNKGDISGNVWLSHDALGILNSGKITEKENGKTKIGGKSDFVCLNKEQLVKILNAEKTSSEPKKRKEIKPEGITESPEPDEDEEAAASLYVPVYLELMFKAAKALNLSADKRANMDDIVGWLNENWPSGLEGKSDRMMKSMATLLRRPQDKKGGNTRWSKE